MQNHLLEIQNVTKRYANKVAVQDVSFGIPQGTVFGLLGPNGAGKTSLIRMITHITMPDSGTIRFRGEALREVHQQQIGYMPEERGLYKKMPVFDQIVYLLELKGMPAPKAKAAAKDWLQRFDLMDWATKKVDNLSKGMQQKVQFIATVAHEPPLLILDEPFSGLDPLNQQLIEDELLRLRDAGTTVIFSTHRMEQVETFCTHLALINQGQLVLNDATQTLRRRYQQNDYILEAEEDLRSLTLPTGVRELARTERTLKVRLPDATAARAFIGWANDQVTITRFALDLPSIRDIFIQAVRASGGEVPIEAQAVPA